MSSSLFKVGALAFLAINTASASTHYVREIIYPGYDFFNESLWNFQEIEKAKGHVAYQSKDNAESAGLIDIRNGHQAYIGVDHTNIITGGGGRPSVRLESATKFNGGLFIADIEHMPGSICGVWPAFWTVGDNWPYNGEIDIIENVNEATSNIETLHTGADCVMDGVQKSSTIVQNGTFTSFDCNNAVNYGSGCSVTDDKANSYGTGFNSNSNGGVKGGVYAMEWTSSSIKIWNWQRDQIPADITNGKPNPALWHNPTSNFFGSCLISEHFVNHTLIINTDFCGDWAAQSWDKTSCAVTGATCEDYVDNHPGDYEEAYWLINNITVYQLEAVTSTSSTISSTSTISSSSTSTSHTSTTTTSSSSSSSSSTVSLTTSSFSSTTSTSSSWTSSLTTPTSSLSTSSSGNISSISSTVTPITSSTYSTTSSASIVATTASSNSSSASISSFSSTSSSSVLYSNSTTKATTTPVSSTTSTVYATSVYTVTSCAATVTDCPARLGQVTTEIVIDYTTVCPVTETETSVPTSSPAPVSSTTSTIYSTTIYTITSCAATVTDCPARIGQVTTEVVFAYTTVCPVTAGSPAASSTASPIASHTPKYTYSHPAGAGSPVQTKPYSNSTFSAPTKVITKTKTAVATFSSFALTAETSAAGASVPAVSATPVVEISTEVVVPVASSAAIISIKTKGGNSTVPTSAFASGSGVPVKVTKSSAGVTPSASPISSSGAERLVAGGAAGVMALVAFAFL